MTKSVGSHVMNDDVYFAFRDSLEDIHGEEVTTLMMGEVSEVEVPFFDLGERAKSLENKACVACTLPCPGSSYTRFIAEEGDSFYLCQSCQDILDI